MSSGPFIHKMNAKNERGFLVDKTEQAIEWMKQQKYEQAAKLFNEIIEQHPEDPLGYINFGNLLMHVNDLDRAMSFFNKAIEIDRQVPAGYYGLGNLYYEQENYPKAQENFQQAIELGLDVGDVYYMLGMSMNQQNLKALAIPYLQRAAELDDNDEAKLFQYGLTLAELNYLPEAKKVFEDVLQINQQHSDAHYNLGVLALYDENSTCALKHFTSALNHQPDHILAANGKEKVEALLREKNP